MAKTNEYVANKALAERASKVLAHNVRVVMHWVSREGYDPYNSSDAMVTMWVRTCRSPYLMRM